MGGVGEKMQDFDPNGYALMVEKHAKMFGLSVFNYGSYVKGRDVPLTRIGFDLSESAIRAKLEEICKTSTP